MGECRTRIIRLAMKAEVIVPSRPIDLQKDQKEIPKRDTKEIEKREIRKKELCQYISDYIKEDQICKKELYD